MAIQQVSVGKAVFICVMAAVSTFAATAIAIAVAGATFGSAILILLAVAVALVPVTRFVVETWKWLSWKEARASRSSVKPGTASAEPNSRQPQSRLVDDAASPADATPAPQPGYVEKTPRFSFRATATARADSGFDTSEGGPKNG
jgi:uncharacterized protein (DUF58 family)